MRPATALAVTVLAATLGACGSDKADPDEQRKEEARQVVIDAIAAYQNEDYETLCDVSGRAILETVPAVTKTKSCPAGYEYFFRHQSESGEARPFDDFVEKLSKTTVGEATVTEDGAAVALDPPGPAATSVLVEEDGQLKIQELFFTANSAAAQGGGAAVVPSG